jgi:hypothetical protein
MTMLIAIGIFFVLTALCGIAWIRAEDSVRLAVCQVGMFAFGAIDLVLFFVWLAVK